MKTCQLVPAANSKWAAEARQVSVRPPGEDSPHNWTYVQHLMSVFAYGVKLVSVITERCCRTWCGGKQSSVSQMSSPGTLAPHSASAQFLFFNYYFLSLFHCGDSCVRCAGVTLCACQTSLTNFYQLWGDAVLCLNNSGSITSCFRIVSTAH